MNDQQMKPGDVVCLKADPKQKFTILSIDGEMAECYDIRTERVKLPLLALRPLPPFVVSAGSEENSDK